MRGDEDGTVLVLDDLQEQIQEATAGKGIQGRGRLVEQHRWGLVPSFAKSLKDGAKRINARAETVATSPSFRSSFRKRRCIVPSDGFYEWRKQPDGSKQPYFITLEAGGPFAFAGLWEAWRSPDGERIELAGGMTLEVWYTPGHSRGHVCFLERAG